MKLITLNSHSIIEPDYEEKLLGFCGVVRKEQPQIMALQEVNQTISAKPAPEWRRLDIFPVREERIWIRRWCAWTIMHSGWPGF
mgnify:CR=1 FL=1